MSIHVLSPGALTTVQDLGRIGFGTWGIPSAGAMDAWALRAANLLVGNDEGAAGLEMTLNGPALSFDQDIVLALTGSVFDTALDGDAVAFGAAFRARAGQTLRIGRTREGARAYLAVRGGIAVEPVMGSRSTHVSAGIGGLDGRPLRTGDVLPIGKPEEDRPLRRLDPGALPYTNERTLRTVSGLQEDWFDTEAFYSSSFTVSPRSDRTGIRLEGPPFRRGDGREVLPQGIPMGALQVPGDGAPILLCAERPTTGGYPIVATVIGADVGLAAHAKPGDTLRFVRVEIEEARAAYRERERALREGVLET